MPELSQELSDFLIRVNRTNSQEDNTSLSYKRIGLDEQLNMFMLSSYQEVGGNIAGHNESETFYFEKDAFLPLVEELKKNGEVVIRLNGFCVARKSRWDHSESQSISISEAITGEDSFNYDLASIQHGPVSGRLVLEEDKLVKYDLSLTPEKDKKELFSCPGPIDDKRIREMITEAQEADKA